MAGLKYDTCIDTVHSKYTFIQSDHDEYIQRVYNVQKCAKCENYKKYVLKNGFLKTRYILFLIHIINDGKTVLDSII